MSRRSLLLGTVVLIALTAVALAYGHYRQKHIWPASIQQEVIGRELATANSLIGMESSASYGQGYFRWRYRLEPGNSWAGLCGNPKPEISCEFTRSRMIGENVIVSIEYENGILTVEEVWL